MGRLNDILPEEFKAGLTLAEARLLDAAEKGEIADLKSSDEALNNPENADKWDNGRTIRSELLQWLCTDKKADELIRNRGIQIIGAKITGALNLNFSFLSKPLGLFSCSINDGISLTQAEAKTFNFNGSHIGSLSADGISVKGNVFLSGVKAKGEVRLLGAKIGGQLDCENAEFVNEEGYAFSADGISVKGDMFLRGVKAKGEVRLLGANIGGQLSCKDAEFVNKEGYAFNATSAIINELLLWETKFKGRLSLSRAKVKVLADDEQSRPDKGKLSIDGFEYEMFRLPKNENAEKRLGWIRLMTESSFYAQPYEQLAKVFKQMGHETDRKKALYEKHEDLRKYGALSKKGKLWNRFLGVTIGHGYKTWRLLLWIIPIILLGAGLFCYADNLEVMQPSKERVYLDPDFKRTGVLPERYSRFNAFIYSIDAFFPFVDLHQEGYYLPDSTRQHGNRFRYYLWLHIFSGWVFSTLAMAAFTGIVRRE